MTRPPHFLRLAAFGVLAVPSQSPPEGAELYLRGSGFKVSWQEPTPLPIETEVEIESGSLTIWSRDLHWIRLVPTDGRLRVTRIRFQNSRPKTSERPEVHLEQAWLDANRSRWLREDLSWIVTARLLRNTELRGVRGSSDTEFWAWARMTAAGADLFEDSWAGGLSGSHQIRYARVRAVVDRVVGEVPKIAFSPCEATPEIREWVSRRITRDYPRLVASEPPNPPSGGIAALLLGAREKLQARYRWIAAALADDSVGRLFEPRALVRIGIVDGEGRPLEPSRVEIVGERPAFFRTTKERLEAVARFGEKGVRAAYLDPGPYAIEVEAAGYDGQSIPLQLEPSAVRDLAVRLERSGPPK